MLESLANLGLTLIEAKQRFAHVQRDVVAAGPQPRLGSALLPSGAHRSTDGRDRVTAKAAIVPQIERLRWRIWHGKGKNAQRSITRIRTSMRFFEGELSQGAKAVVSSTLWHTLGAIDKRLP